MAKVYDALKRVEAERQRQRTDTADEKALLDPGGEARPALWKRWSSRWTQRPGEHVDLERVELAAAQQLDRILDRLDAIEDRAGRAPDGSEHLLRIIDVKLNALERERDEQDRRLLRQFDDRLRWLAVPIWIAAACCAATLAATLLRGW